MMAELRDAHLVGCWVEMMAANKVGLKDVSWVVTRVELTAEKWVGWRAERMEV